MAVHINETVSMVIFIFFLIGFGSALRVVIDPHRFDRTTEALVISCIADGPAYEGKSISMIQIMKESEDTPIASVSTGHELTLGAGVKKTKAAGSVHDSTRSYLTITIDKPSREDAGIYKCQAFLTDENFQSVEESVLGNAIALVSCPEGWSHYEKDGTCIKAFGRDYTSEHLSWPDARVACQRFGGDLVQIRDGAKNNFVFNLLNKERGYDAWIGMKNQAARAYDFKYVDGSDMGSYHPWSSTEPDGYSNDYDKCVGMWTASVYQGHWHDDTCSHREAYVCSV